MSIIKYKKQSIQFNNEFNIIPFGRDNLYPNAIAQAYDNCNMLQDAHQISLGLYNADTKLLNDIYSDILLFNGAWVNIQLNALNQAIEYIVIPFEQVRFKYGKQSVLICADWGDPYNKNSAYLGLENWMYEVPLFGNEPNEYGLMLPIFVNQRSNIVYPKAYCDSIIPYIMTNINTNNVIDETSRKGFKKDGLYIFKSQTTLEGGAVDAGSNQTYRALVQSLSALNNSNTNAASVVINIDPDEDLQFQEMSGTMQADMIQKYIDIARSEINKRYLLNEVIGNVSLAAGFSTNEIDQSVTLFKTQMRRIQVQVFNELNKILPESEQLKIEEETNINNNVNE
jgi:hypothetical protein